MEIFVRSRNAGRGGEVATLPEPWSLVHVEGRIYSECSCTTMKAGLGPRRVFYEDSGSPVEALGRQCGDRKVERMIWPQLTLTQGSRTGTGRYRKIHIH